MSNLLSSKDFVLYEENGSLMANDFKLNSKLPKVFANLSVPAGLLYIKSPNINNSHNLNIKSIIDNKIYNEFINNVNNLNKKKNTRRNKSKQKKKTKKR
tara:strand:+ start:582 stop:878 length:297 start_codon:yes stop_codon:yes gene_type:complete